MINSTAHRHILHPPNPHHERAFPTRVRLPRDATARHAISDQCPVMLIIFLENLETFKFEQARPGHPI